MNDGSPFVDFGDRAEMKRGLITAALGRIRDEEGDGSSFGISFRDVEAAVDVAVDRMYGNPSDGYEIHIPFEGGGVLQVRVRPYPNY